MPHRLLPLALTAGCLAVPASAHAGAVTIGSDLTADAALTESHPRDWGAWPTAIASGGAVTAPAYGEVSIVQLKGTARKPTNDSAYRGEYPPFNVIITVMRPQAGGAVKMVQASGDLFALPGFPFGKPADTITTWNLQDYSSRVCVEPGDHVALNTSGGFGNTDPAFGGFPDNYYEDGYPMQVFGRVPGSTTALFEQGAVGGDDGNGFQVGDVETGTPQQGRELLMRVTIATEKDARYTCWSPELKEQANELSTGAIPDQAFKLRLDRRRRVPIRIACVSARSCSGELNLKHGAKAVAVRTPFTLEGEQTATLPVQINANGMRLLKLKKGRMKVTAYMRVSGRKNGLYTRDFKLVR